MINLLPQQAPSKGTAVDRIRTQLQARETLYVGDDRIDEDVFALDGITGVRIGGEGPSAARYCLKDQTGIDDLLEHLIELRPSRVTRWTEEKRSRAARGSGW